MGNTNGAVINGAGSAAAEENKISFNKWEATSFGNDTQTEKFRRLTGIKTTKPPQENSDSGIEEDKKKKSADAPTPAAVKRKSSPFRRVKSEDVEVKAKFSDNRFDGSFDEWGAKANKDLLVTQGKKRKLEETMEV